MQPPSKRLEQLVSIADKAGQVIMAIYATDFDVKTKSDESPLTRADEAAHRLIKTALQQMTPNIPILSEEETDITGREQWGGGTYWLVDPLDGTKEFIKRNGEFTVNIALIENGQASLGVVHAPAMESTYAAAVGVGAYKSVANGPWHTIHCKKHIDGTPWRVVGSRSHAGDSLSIFLARLGQTELVSMGSSLKLCLIAEGAADIYPRLGPTSLWDTAAAQCVVEAAGGKVVSLEGMALSYEDTSQLLNPQFLVHSNDDVNWFEIFH